MVYGSWFIGIKAHGAGRMTMGVWRLEAWGSPPGCRRLIVGKKAQIAAVESIDVGGGAGLSGEVVPGRLFLFSFCSCSTSYVCEN